MQIRDTSIMIFCICVIYTVQPDNMTKNMQKKYAEYDNIYALDGYILG